MLGGALKFAKRLATRALSWRPPIASTGIWPPHPFKKAWRNAPSLPTCRLVSAFPPYATALDSATRAFVLYLCPPWARWGVRGRIAGIVSDPDPASQALWPCDRVLSAVFQELRAVLLSACVSVLLLVVSLVDADILSLLTPYRSRIVKLKHDCPACSALVLRGPPGPCHRLPGPCSHHSTSHSLCEERAYCCYGVYLGVPQV